MFPSDFATFWWSYQYIRLLLEHPDLPFPWQQMWWATGHRLGSEAWEDVLRMDGFRIVTS